MNCIFGIFDILGFTSFCENCDFTDAEKVLKIMDDFETEIPEILLHELDVKNDTSQDKINMLKSRLKWLTFSDTIFVAMPLDSLARLDKEKFNLIFLRHWLPILIAKCLKSACLCVARFILVKRW